jgi:hypothetical protein
VYFSSLKQANYTLCGITILVSLMELKSEAQKCQNDCRGSPTKQALLSMKLLKCLNEVVSPLTEKPLLVLSALQKTTPQSNIV